MVMDNFGLIEMAEHKLCRLTHTHIGSFIMPSKNVIKKNIDYSLSPNASRDEIGNLFCSGEGIEIGAGLRPTKISPDAVVHYTDKRNPDELISYFSSNDVVISEPLSSFDGRTFDFLIAHHVLEHSANVIQTLVDWIKLLKNGSILYLSLPNRHITPDANRLLTPPTHFLLDYAYQVSEDDFESRDHICGFLWGWIDTGGLQGKTKLEAADSVVTSLNSEVNDLHWHTFNFDSFLFVVKIAATISGYSAEVVFSQDGFVYRDEHRLVCRLVKNSNSTSEKLNEYLEISNKLRDIIYGVTLENMDGVATYSLSSENKGKIFFVENGVFRWIRSASTLEDMGLSSIDYTYLEISENEKDILGKDIQPQTLNRIDAITNRLKPLRKSRGIELSPGAEPIISKNSFNVLYVDRFDHSKNSDSYLHGRPVFIDLLLGDQLIDEILDHDGFSYLFSSHVIEYIPDFIQFFISAKKILAKGGRLIMYVPDKRYTFDVLRATSSVRDIEHAHKLKLRHPTLSMAKDVYSLSDFNVEAAKLWNNSYTPTPSYTKSEALNICENLDLLKADMHCFTFTPESFLELIIHIKNNYVPEFEVIEITETNYGAIEFIVDLILK